MASSKPGGYRHNIVAAGFGNLLEWYDFGVYGFFAVIIGQHFFPSDDPFASLLSAFGVFAVGYGARPVGALVLGNLGDKIGRRPVLMLSLTIMGAATFAIGVLPGFEEIGVAAPLLLVALRLIQGFAVAAECPTSTVYLVEQAPAGRRGLHSCWTMFGAFVGLLLGSGVGALASSVMSEAALHAWGWRVPFLLSLVLTVAGLLFRRQLIESAAMTEAAPQPGAPVVTALREQWPWLLRYIGMIAMGGVGFYLAYVYAISDLTQHMKISTAKALSINTLALFSILLVVPLAGLLSDRIGRKPVAYFSALGNLVLAWPFWWMMHQDHFLLILAGQVGFAVLFGTGLAVTALMITEVLPLRARCSVIAIGNGIAYGVFGGLTPLTATYLVERTADDFAPAYMIIALAVISVLACRGVPERAGQELV